ncbi:MAG: type II secretion system F family protein [Mycobacterium sp.]
MTGPITAALALALALLVLPRSPRRRLASPKPRGARVPRATGWPMAGCAAAAGLVIIVLLPLTTVLAAAVLSATLALRHRRRRCARRAGDEGRALAAAMDVLVGELRAGAHPVCAFGVAADESSGTVAESCRAVAARARLGADVAAGLRGAAETSALPAQWLRLAVCWRLANDHGLAMARLMRAAQRDIAERQRFSAQVTSAMAGARASATVLASLPVLSVVLGELIGARPVAFLLAGQAGGWLLVVGVALISAGLLWSDRITDRVTP